MSPQTMLNRFNTRMEMSLLILTEFDNLKPEDFEIVMDNPKIFFYALKYPNKFIEKVRETIPEERAEAIKRSGEGKNSQEKLMLHLNEMITMAGSKFQNI